jgi:hypothetical protein
MHLCYYAKSDLGPRDLCRPLGISFATLELRSWAAQEIPRGGINPLSLGRPRHNVPKVH